MARTVDQVRYILYDLKYSGYFRAWAIIWFVCFVFSFSVLIMLSQRADEAGNERDIHLQVSQYTQMTFPRFHFRISNMAIKGAAFYRKSCTHNGAMVLTAPCQDIQGVTPSVDVCFAVTSDQIVVTPSQTDHKTITCVMEVNGYNDTMIAWGLEGAQAVGSNSYADIYVASNNDAYVMVSQVNLLVNGQTIANWDRSLVYHSSVAIPGHFVVKTKISSFFVSSLSRKDSYDGYRAMGDIGGFFYFMVIIHTFLMIIIGAFLSNTSKFLGGETTTH